jgi:type I restriction enzyme S subunit
MTEGPYKLPEGWRWVRLGEVCEVLMGQSPPSSTYNHDGLGLPFFQGKADFGELYPTPRVWCTKPMKIAEAGDILISVRAPVGPTNLAKERCCIGRGLAALRARHEIQTGWLLFCLRSIEQELGQFGSGSTFHAITKKELSAILIPLPPLAEQRRIVARIEELMGRVREARRLRQEAQKDAERLWQSVLAQTFPRPGSDLPEGWRWVRLGEVCTLIEVGFAFRKKGAPEGDLLHLRPYNIGEDGTLVLSQRFYLPSSLGLARHKMPQPGDVLFNNTNSVELVGKTALVREPLEAAFSNHITLLRSDTTKAEGASIALALQALWRQGFFANLCNKWIGQAGINTETLKSILIPLPPLAEQHRIVAHLQAVQEKIKALKEAQAATEAELKRLEQAILEKAFRGEL